MFNNDRSSSYQIYKNFRSPIFLIKIDIGTVLRLGVKSQIALKELIIIFLQKD